MHRKYSAAMLADYVAPSGSTDGARLRRLFRIVVQIPGAPYARFVALPLARPSTRIYVTPEKQLQPRNHPQTPGSERNRREVNAIFGIPNNLPVTPEGARPPPITPTTERQRRLINEAFASIVTQLNFDEEAEAEKFQTLPSKEKLPCCSVCIREYEGEKLMHSWAAKGKLPQIDKDDDDDDDDGPLIQWGALYGIFIYLSMGLGLIYLALNKDIDFDDFTI